MRKRYQKGTVKLVKGKWIAQWRENGQKRKRTLGRGPKMTKSEAGTKLAEIVAPINARGQDPSPDMAFGMFVTTVYLPFYGRKWKRSTSMSNNDRLERYLVSEFGARKLGSFRRDELQDFLDRRGSGRAVIQHRGAPSLGHAADIQDGGGRGFHPTEPR
jgi:hypothetical protein